jgi:hypothetical protein
VATGVYEEGKTESNLFSYSFSLEQAARDYTAMARSQWKADSRGLNAGSEAKPNDMGTRRKEAEYRGNGWNRSSRYGTFLHGASGGSTLAGVKYCQPDNLIFFVSDDYIVICQFTLKFTINHDKMFTSGELPDSRKPILSTAQDTRWVFHSLKNLQPQPCHRESR